MSAIYDLMQAAISKLGADKEDNASAVVITADNASLTSLILMAGETDGSLLFSGGDAGEGSNTAQSSGTVYGQSNNANSSDV